MAYGEASLSGVHEIINPVVTLDFMVPTIRPTHDNNEKNKKESI